MPLGDAMGKILVVGICSGGFAAADVIRHPLNTGVALEHTQFFDAVNYQSTNYQPVTTMMRPTGWIFQAVTLDERVDVVFGIGATAFSLARSGPTGSGYENEMFPAVAMVQASGTYKWGGSENPTFKAGFGAMPYKYNPDARDLGEYLFRSTPYPNTVLNSPFDLTGSAKANVLGGILSGNFAEGKWKNDLLVTSMNWTTPLYDFSAAWVTRFRIHPVFELGAGVNLYRVLPVTAKGTRNENAGNAYFTFAGDAINPDDPNDVVALSGRQSARADYYEKKGTRMDSARAWVAKEYSDALALGTPLPAGISDAGYYTFQGSMLTARFALDFTPVLGDALALKLYGEWAWLGVENQPVFYEKPGERMPIMLGLNVPTFGLLDALGVEVQYWKNPWLNSLVEANYNAITAIPDMNGQTRLNLGLKQNAVGSVTSDDVAWSVVATKSLGRFFSVTAKAAKDNAQLMQLLGAGFPGKSYGDVMAGEDSWYYVLRLQLAI